MKYMKTNKGVTLLISIITTSVLLLVSFVVANVALKQLILAYSGEQSQYSFYNAETGIECAVYWDSHYGGGGSAFDPSTEGSVNCVGQTFVTDSPYSLIGGGGLDSTKFFTINFSPHGCVTVEVVKGSGGGTTIESRGYNNCDPGADRKFERAIRVTYN